MGFIITTQITEDYYVKSKPLFDSIKKYWDGRFVVGFIDFLPNDYVGEHYLMEKKDIYTYRLNYPKNRKSFVCPQGGEFIDYLDCDDNDIIIEIDADTIIQRAITETELLELIPDENEIISVYCANPQLTLYDVARNLKFLNLENYEKFKNLKEFTGSILIANRRTFVKLRDLIISEWDEFIKINTHHAGIQWLISKASHENFKIKILNNIFQCGIWYQTFNTSIRNHKLYIDDNVVIFNHTQFNDKEFIVKNIVPTWDINIKK